MLALVKEGTSRIHGCLASIATPDTAARWRYPLNAYEAQLPPFVRDACVIRNCDAFRRLAGKPAVISFPTNTHVLNRLTHVLGVVSVATTIGSIVGLNVSLCEAAAYGHDLGHVPYGHYGERVIYGLRLPRFRHQLFGPVVAQHIERGGNGLNLTYQTLVCMRDHSRGEGDLHTNGHLPEADVVMYADKIMYIFSDADDFFERSARTGVRFPLGEHPSLWRRLRRFGQTAEERVQRCVTALCEESAEYGRVSFRTSETAMEFDVLRRQMYEELYEGEIDRFEQPPTGHLNGPSDLVNMITDVTDALAEIEPTIAPELLIALMTDTDIARLWDRIHCAPDAYGSILKEMSISDLLPSLRGRKIDMDNPDLDW